jgi:very-short-patch-repair endonuclease
MFLNYWKSPLELFALDLKHVCPRVESPIENIIGLVLAWRIYQINEVLSAVRSNYIFKIRSQVRLVNYRCDFLISVCEPNGSSSLILEVDGRDYHTTEEQVARDKRRDRELAIHTGCPVIRLTGSEIWNDPFGYAEDVLSYFDLYGVA